MEGINSHIMGGYLEGGIGEIQPMGVITLVVAKPDYEQAGTLIEAWEDQQVETESDASLQVEQQTLSVDNSSEKSPFPVTPFVVFAVIMLMLLWYFFLPQ